MVAEKLATWKDGQRADLVEGLPIGRASEMLNVGERSVARAREVQEHTNCCLWPPEATCRRPHQPIARHRLLAHRAVSTAESLTKLTGSSSGCIPRCRRSSCSPVKRGRDGRRGAIK